MTSIVQRPSGAPKLRRVAPWRALKSFSGTYPADSKKAFTSRIARRGAAKSRSA